MVSRLTALTKFADQPMEDRDLAVRMGGVIEEAVRHVKEELRAEIAKINGQGGFSLENHHMIGALGEEMLRKAKEADRRILETLGFARSMEHRFGEALESVKSFAAPATKVGELESVLDEISTNVSSALSSMRSEFESAMSRRDQAIGQMIENSIKSGLDKLEAKLEAKFSSRIGELVSAIKSLPVPVIHNEVSVPKPEISEVRVILEQKPVRRDLVLDDKTGRTIGMIERPVN